MDRRDFIKNSAFFLAVGSMMTGLHSCEEKTVMPWDKDPNFGKKDEEPEIDEAEVGKPLPAWSEGYFDIHAVNSGRGECSFLIFPDGTSMVIDAGEVTGSSSYPSVPARPSDSVSAVDAYVHYFQHFLPAVCNGKIDYMMLTHFHNDHLGTCTSTKFAMNTAGNYRKTGIMGVYDQIKFSKYVDRSYPEYTDAALQTTDYTSGYNMLANFTSYNIKQNGLVCEKFDLGSDSQFAMKYDPSKYDFKCDNVSSNGVICVNGTKTDCYGSASHAENGMSNGCLFTYGKFNYLTCGDGGHNGKIEQPLAKALNKRIEAMKANHHMSVNTQTPTAMAIYMPRVIVTQSFYERDEQPNVDVLANLYKSYLTEKNLYFTNVVEAQQTKHSDVYSQAAGINGHVVIRVAPGGETYTVYMLDDTDFNYTVKSIDGPYNCI